MAYKNIIAEKRGTVGLITLNRPKALNALNAEMLDELCASLSDFERDAHIGAVVLTGSEKAFAAGADIKEMQELNYINAYVNDLMGAGGRIAEFRKPLIAAVNGYALGGGCELAMICDFMIAGKSAKFGQPEITLGIIPGIGGSQRMARSIGKAKTMDMILTGRLMDAVEAERCGLVSRIVDDHDVVETAISAAQKIADFSRASVMMAKEAVNRAFETTLSEGLRFEKRMFQSLFSTEDQKEGMNAFIEKRSPSFKNR
ncbi:MAG: enoyl-CoA hydratase [Ahrensia sp.]|nr:enoyl-CoA hydratase [Ahrensia sp.]